jgi:hypothetical protein
VRNDAERGSVTVSEIVITDKKMIVREVETDIDYETLVMVILTKGGEVLGLAVKRMMMMDPRMIMVKASMRYLSSHNFYFLNR